MSELREGLEAAIRAAKLAIFVIKKQGVMPNSSWENGFNADLTKAENALSAAPRTEPCGGWPSEDEIARVIVAVVPFHSLTVDDCRIVARAVLSSLPRPQGHQHPDKWRDIGSAPKDGTRVVAYSAERCENCVDSSGMSVARWQDSAWICGRLKADGQYIRSHHQPTHWQPLPAPPASVSHSTMHPGKLPSEIK